MTIHAVRRYFLRKSQELDRRWLPSLAGAYRAKQDAQPGTALALDFPLRAQLAAQLAAFEQRSGRRLIALETRMANLETQMANVETALGS